MKSRKRPSKLPEEWEVIPDTHEGIVTQEEFGHRTAAYDEPQAGAERRGI